MIKVLHLSYCDKNTGAGIAAQRIHDCIVDYPDSNISSFLRINIGDSEVKNIIRTNSRITKIYNLIKKYLERLLIKFINFNDKCFHSISVFPSLKHNEINKLDIDLIHIHWVQHEMISIEEIGKIKFPIVWTLHDCWPFSSTEHYQKNNKDNRYVNGYEIKNFFNLYEYIDKLCFIRKKNKWKNNISLIAPSKWIADCAKNSILMKDKRIEIIPNPINTEIFFQKDKKAAQEIIKTNPNKKVLLFGSLDGEADPRKGADLLIKTIEHLTSLKDEIQLIIFGKRNNKLLDISKLETINLGIINSNHEMAKIYSAADIFIIPSRIESFGQTAAEAQSCGIPVIGFNVGGLKDIIDHEINGLLVEPYNCEEMALGIKNLIRNKVKMHKFSEASREKALRYWDKLRVAKLHTKFYKNIIKNG